jgi:alpha-beta hydrolase superfamily lysophospholipase
MEVFMKKTALFFSCALFLALSWSPARAATKAGDVTFNTSDGVKIAATYFPGDSGKPGIVLVHMLSRTRTDWRDFAFKAQEEGYNVLTIDLRGHGGSTVDKMGRTMDFQKFTQTEWNNLPLDVAAATKFLADKSGLENSKIFLIGASIGANAALIFASSSQPPVRGVVLLSPGTEYHGLSIAGAAKVYKGAAFWIAANADAYSAQTVRELARDTGAQTKLYSGNEHGTKMFSKYRDLEKQIFDWLAGRSK